MKRLLFLTLLTFCLASIHVMAQTNGKKFSGTITYKVTYPANATNPMVSALPTTIEMQISGNKARIDMVLPFGKNAFIMNGDDQTVVRLAELESGKYFVKKTKEDFAQTSAPLVAPLKETKNVAGYLCHTAEVNTTAGGKSTKSKVYYSSDLGTNNIYFNTNVRSLSGIMLEFDYQIMGVPVKLNAISINPGRVSGKQFEIPAGYTETSEAKLREMRGPLKK